MSFVVMGLTHCSKCGSPLGDSLVCAECEDKENKEREQKLNMLLALSKEEIEAVKCVAIEKAKELRREKIKKTIKELEAELGDEK